MNIFLGDVLAKNPKMYRFCKIIVTDTLRLEAVYLGKYRWEKSEEERKRIEEEERKKAEAEADAEAGGWIFKCLFIQNVKEIKI